MNNENNTKQWDAYDHGYATYHVYHLSSALRKIAEPGWVKDHLRSFYLLAKSPELSPLEQKTVIRWFGLSAFHVLIQGTPISDGLVKTICHSGDKEMILRRAGEMANYYSAYGSYPPQGRIVPNPNEDTRKYYTLHGPLFDAIE